jgi:hypothetical protein
VNGQIAAIFLGCLANRFGELLGGREHDEVLCPFVAGVYRTANQTPKQRCEDSDAPSTQTKFGFHAAGLQKISD